MQGCGEKMNEVCRGESHVAGCARIQRGEMGLERSIEGAGGRESNEAASNSIRRRLEGGNSQRDGNPDAGQPSRAMTSPTRTPDHLGSNLGTTTHQRRDSDSSQASNPRRHSLERGPLFYALLEKKKTLPIERWHPD